ncbi:MAG: hypothetical protein IT559_06580 [Alphaproteobacteria bacterium]|nr:hypothetical protein [Alphaproteobacteria bacterium]
MALKNKMSSYMLAFSLYAAGGAEAKPAPHYVDNNKTPAVQKIPDIHPCAGDAHEKDCRIIEEMTDEQMKPIEIRGVDMIGAQICYQGTGARIKEDLYLRAFSKAACGKDNAGSRVNYYKDVKEAFSMNGIPPFIILRQPFSPDDHDYEGPVGQFRFVGEGYTGESIYLECQSAVVVEHEGAYTASELNCGLHND